LFDGSQFKADAHFEGADFNCTLYLPLTKYEYGMLYIRWHSIKNLDYDDAAYLSLLENFKKLGYTEDYDNCYYEYRKEHRGRDWNGKYHRMHWVEEWVRKRIEGVLEVTYGYGKKPLYPLIWSIGVVLLFGAFWSTVRIKDNEYSTARDQTLDGYPLKPGKWYRDLLKPGPYLFSAAVLISGTRLFVDPPKIPESPRWSRYFINGMFILERVFGAFFSILFFLAIGATVIR
jgi:hypothetical protein